MVIGLVGGSLGILVVALPPNIPVLLVGWCIAQLLFNALLAALVAVLKNLAAAPEFVWELSLGIYLMVKGFRPSPITSGMATAGAPPAYHDVDA
jgi:hypothetical protein